MSGFLCSYGPEPSITCTSCRKRTRMVPAATGDVSPDDVARYKRLHRCGPPGQGWDIGDADAWEPVRW